MSLAANWVDFAVSLVWPFFAILFVVVLLTGPGRRFFGPILGRLKSFKAGGFEFDLTPDKPLKLTYRVWVQEGEMTVEQCEAMSRGFVHPPEVKVAK